MFAFFTVSKFWWNVREPLFNFAGRRSELHTLEELFKKNKTVAICGFRGIGKSELARKFAQIRGESGYNVIWINAEWQTHVEDTFNNIADELCLLERENHSKEKAHFEKLKRIVYNHISRTKTLIIFDNALKEIRYFLPSLHPMTNNLHVLITSCYQEFDSSLEKISLSVWNESEAINFVQKELNGDLFTQQEIKSICEVLCYSPLALQQAIALIKKRNLIQSFSLSDFIILYNDKQNYVLASSLPMEQAYEGTTVTSTLVTFEAAKNSKFGTAAKQILILICLVKPDDIPCRFITLMLDNEEEYILEAISILTNNFLITCYPKGDESFFSIQRLIQQVLVMEFDEEEKFEIARFVFRSWKLKLTSRYRQKKYGILQRKISIYLKDTNPPFFRLLKH